MCATSSGNSQWRNVSTLKASPTHARTCVPQGAWLLHRLLFPKPGPGWGKRGPGTPCGVRFRAAPEPVFSPTRDRHVSALGSQIQDPGSGSRIGTRPALGASQKARGLHRRPLSFGASGQAGSGGFSSRWGGLQWQPLMLGTFQRKVLFDEYATRIAGTRVMVGVDTSLMAAPNGGPGFLAAGTSHVHGHLHGLL